ncbi:MAG: hypothetical protein AB7U52_01950 [Candidatus Izemoplasmatales bacterium]
MKKIKYLALFLITFVTFIMVGCDATSNTLDDLDKAIANVETASQQTDYQEISELVVEEATPMNMSFTELELDPLQEFIDLRTSFLENHLLLQTQRLTFQLNKEELRSLISLFKDSELQLSEQDNEIIKEKIELFRSYRQEFLDTKGLAYLRIYNLKDQYKIEDIEMINQTISEVNEVLLLRITLFEKTNQDIEEIIAILTGYTEI